MSDETALEKNVEYYLKLGKNEFDKKRYSIAVEFFDKALKLNPENAESWKFKGESLLSQYKFDQALECFEKALGLDVNNKEIWRLKVSTLHNLNRHEESLACCEEALKRFPDIHLWFMKGLSSKALNQEYYSSLERTLELCNEKLSVNPEDIETWCTKAATLWWMDRSQDSLECCEKALELKPKHEGALTVKAAALLKFRMYKEATKNCDKLLRIDPRNATAWNIKGTCLASQGKYRDAIKCYDKALELNPYDVASSTSKNQCLLALGIRLCPVCNSEATKLYSKHGAAYICPKAKLTPTKSKFPVMGILPCYGKKPQISKSWFGIKCPNCGSVCLKYVFKEGFSVHVCLHTLTRASDGTIFMTCKSYEDNFSS